MNTTNCIMWNNNAERLASYKSWTPQGLYGDVLTRYKDSSEYFRTLYDRVNALDEDDWWELFAKLDELNPRTEDDALEIMYKQGDDILNI